MNRPRSTRSTSPSSLGRSRGCARGAIMVEATIVISIFTLALIGLMFFRQLYVRQLGAARLARASVIAHSMAGCVSQSPRDWIGTKDLATLTAGNPPPADQQPAQGQNVTGNANPSGDHSDTASGIVNKLGSTTGDGQGFLNPITEADLSGKASASTQTSALAPRKTIFESTVHAKSYVSCGDEVKDGDYGEVVNRFTSELKSLF